MASIAAAKTTLEITPTKHGDFKLAADFLVLNAPRSRIIQQEHCISAVGHQATSDNEGDKTQESMKHVKVE